MDNNQLNRLMRIARKTNSPVVVLDENQEEMVILPLSSYEALIDEYSDEECGLSEEFFVDEEFEGFDGEIESEESLDEFSIEASDIDLEELPEELESVVQENEGLTAEKGPEIDPESAEEQFYLEPVE